MSIKQKKAGEEEDKKAELQKEEANTAKRKKNQKP